MDAPGFILTEPWSWLLEGPFGPLDLRPGHTVPASGQGSPRALVPWGEQLRWSAPIGAGPNAGFPFIDWGGEKYGSQHLPCSHRPQDSVGDITQSWHVGTVEGVVTQTNVMPRPSDGTLLTPSIELDTFISWIVHGFQELAQDQEHEGDSIAGDLVRRSWEHVRATWLEPDPDEPRMELIVRMAQDERLRVALESVSGYPRRILLRVREQTKIGRITELDAACIRDFARRPGRSPIEKAGTRQELLAVRRQASHDTLENRVSCWTLDELHRRSHQWKRRHHHSRASAGTRAKAVTRLSSISTQLRNSESLAPVETKGLLNPVVANYPLLMETRYRHIYRAYKKLLRYNRVIDDAWTWRRALWTDAVRQLIACSLFTEWKDGMTTSLPYFRTEGERGRWIATPSSPGPFETAQGPLIVLDAHDVENLGEQWWSSPPAPWFHRIGALGPDLVLWWPKAQAVVVVWSVLWSGAESDCVGQAARAAQAIEKFTLGLSFFRIPSVRVSGLLMTTGAGLDAVELDVMPPQNHRVVTLRLPLGIDTTAPEQFAALVHDLHTGINLSIESAMSGSAP